MILLPGLEQVDANVEMSYAPAASGHSGGLLLCAAPQSQNSILAGVSGFLASTITLLYKYTALPVLAFVFIVWLFEMWRQARNLKAIVVALARGCGRNFSGGTGVGIFPASGRRQTFIGMHCIVQ